MKCCYISYRFNTNRVSYSEFHRVDAAVEKALVPTFVLTLGRKSRLELDDRGCLAGVSSECKYAGWMKVLGR